MVYNKLNNKQYILLLVIIYFCYGKCYSQINLIPNSSFEQYTNCPDNLSTQGIINGRPIFWNKPDKGGASYVNICSNNQPLDGIPYNNALGGNSYQYPRTGNAYFVYFFYNFNYNNYINVKLIDSLKASRKYYAEYYVNLGNNSNKGCNNIGMLFTNNVVYADTINQSLLLANPQIVGYGNPIVTDTMGWVKISGIFTAQGGEQYLTLGNFKSKANTQTQTIQTNGYDGSGYYVDDVAVYNLDSFCLQADAGRDTTIKINDSVYIGSYTNGIDTIKWYNAVGQVIDSTRPGFWVKPNATGNYMYVVEQTVNGCTTRDTVYINAILPLRMLSYELRVMSERQVLNSWITANEVNVHHFNIQRSTNGKDFTTIGTVRANNKSYNEYNYIDGIGHWALGIGKVYYRIESIDKDGKINYSAVNSVELRVNSEGISVYPNPAKDVVTISSKEPISKLLIIDYLGRTVYEQIASCLAMTNNTNHLSLKINHYPRGLYVVRIITNSGKVYNEKLLVN